MFISVVLPAPLSPKSAMISPRRNSMLIESLARSAAKRLVIPPSRSTTSGSGDGDMELARFRLFVVDFDNKRPALDLFLARLDLALHLVWNFIVESPKRRKAAATVLHERVDSVVLRRERSILHLGDSLIKGRLEMPQRRNYDGFGVIRLSVDDISDREDIAFLGGIRDAEAFRIHQVGARIDLSQSRLLGF